MNESFYYRWISLIFHTILCNEFMKYILFNVFLAMPVSCGSSQARDLSSVTATTQASAVIVQDLNPQWHKRTPPHTFFFFNFLGPHLWYMEVPRLGAELELQLLAYTTATAAPDLSYICNLHHSS